LDYAGFSTFETLIRAREIFGVQTATLITQSYHLPRALYIAEKRGLSAVGYAAKEPSFEISSAVRLREIAARVVTFGDLNIWGRKPRFLGAKEYINMRNS
jgi:SanA protein